MSGDTLRPTRVLVLGAAGSLARVAIDRLLEEPNLQLTLYLRRATRLARLASTRVRVVEGDVLDAAALTAAMRGHDVVYANLAGPMARMAETVVAAMHATGVRRLIFVSSMGIYDEVPGQRYRAVLDPYRDSAAVVEASDLDYTVLRPAWFTDDPTVDYALTQKGEPFRGGSVSRASLADLITKLCTTPGFGVRRSLGVSAPE